MPSTPKSSVIQNPFKRWLSIVHKQQHVLQELQQDTGSYACAISLLDQPTGLSEQQEGAVKQKA